MNRNTLLIGLGAAIVLWLLYNRQQVAGTLSSAIESSQAAFMGWETVNQGPVWVPVINQTEAALGIPPNLLARQAYQESRFRPEIIDGTQASPAGALGIMQLMPQYFTSVQVQRPYTIADTQAQISEAGNYIASLFAQFGDWGLALAAYNDGPTNVKHFMAGVRALPTETQNYVAQILADVPVPSVLTSAPGVSSA